MLETLIVAAVIIAAGAFIYMNKKKKKVVVDIVVTEPPEEELRDDLLYGYYYTKADQVDEVADHTNLHWGIASDGEDLMLDRIEKAAMTTVLDVGAWLIDRASPNKVVLKPGDEPRHNLRGLLTRMRERDLLKYVKVIVPLDEPNLPANSFNNELPEIMNIIKEVVSEFPELEGVKYGIIYFNNDDKQHLDLFDIIGVDDYPKKSQVLAPGQEYDWFRSRMKPHQKLWLIPGAYVKQDPTPFVNYAHKHSDVWAIVPFLWADVPNGDGEGKHLVGIRSIPEMKEVYTEVGKKLTGK